MAFNRTCKLRKAGRQMGVRNGGHACGCQEGGPLGMQVLRLTDLMAESGACPDGFVKFQQSCYHFSHDQETWFDAASACQTVFNKAYLAEIDSQAENQFLLHYAAKRQQ
ncbi:perlucin-like protein [Dreissena polymorpha]|uniref:perlucin-like protein n=1 Tax=Dreissena polymorpha TaxID=45954 RepID=UPI0022641C69|nr:perlucin-like protein [Dreissena polymorpha]